MAISVRKKVKEALRAGNYEEITELALKDKRVFSTLISSAYNKDDIICWRAIEAMGLAVKALAQTDLNQARDILHRLLWSIREESGTLGWSSPEMLGEIVRHDPRSFSDMPPIILSFHDERFLLPGVIWAVGRMARAGIAIEGVPQLLEDSLGDGDPAIRGLAAWASAWVDDPAAASKLERLVGDEQRFNLYDQGQLQVKTVGEAASAALNALSV